MEPITFKILVVDDDADDRWMIDEAFKALHFEAEVKKFIHGPALLRYLDSIKAENHPSLIVLDNFLPGMNTLAIVRLLKERKGVDRIPIAILSSGHSPLLHDELVALGVTTWYDKGYTQEQTLETAQQLKALVERRQQKEHGGLTA